VEVEIIVKFYGDITEHKTMLGVSRTFDITVYNILSYTWASMWHELRYI